MNYLKKAEIDFFKKMQREAKQMIKEREEKERLAKIKHDQNKDNPRVVAIKHELEDLQQEINYIQEILKAKIDKKQILRDELRSLGIIVRAKKLY